MPEDDFQRIRAHQEGVHFGLLLVMVLDIFMTSLYDDLHSLLLISLFAALQLFVISCMLFLLYLLISRTSFFKYQLYGPLLRKFKLLSFCTLLYLVSWILMRGLQMFLLYFGFPHLSLWEVFGYYPMYLIHRFSLICFYISVVRAAVLLKNPKYFSMKRSAMRKYLRI